MTHQRDVIRNAVRARLIGDSTHPWGDRVWVNRPNPLSDRPHQDSNRSRLPAVLIYTRSEQAEKFNEAPREYLRTVELVVEVAAAMNDAIDDTLDGYAEIIERLILNDPYLGDAAADTLLVSSDLTIVGRETERPIGAAILTFDVTYLQHFPDAAFNDTLDDLETVHVDYNLGGEQAEADRTSDTITLPDGGACAITLTGDIGPIAGYAAADVSDQSFSVTDAEANIYMASTDIMTRRPMPPPGKKVWIQVDSFSASGGFGTNARAGYYAFDSAGDPIAFVTVNGNAGGALGVAATSVSGAALANTLFPQGFVPYVSLGIDSDGELYFYRADTSEVVALADIEPAFAGVLAGAESLILLGMCDLSGGGPASAGARFVTDQSEMLDADYLGGGEDWCGNAISDEQETP